MQQTQKCRTTQMKFIKVVTLNKTKQFYIIIIIIIIDIIIIKKHIVHK